eukprot:1682305-Amphidinium_carterae.1
MAMLICSSTTQVTSVSTTSKVTKESCLERLVTGQAGDPMSTLRNARRVHMHSTRSKVEGP